MRPKILIVDDDEGIRTQLKWGLEGYEVVTADSRLSAIEQFDLHHPPLVTLDLGLPPDSEGVTEGFAILKEIIKKEPKTKIVVISGSENTGNAQMAKDEGAYEYYPKPIELEYLQKIMQRAYSRFQED